MVFNIGDDRFEGRTGGPGLDRTPRLPPAPEKIIEISSEPQTVAPQAPPETAPPEAQAVEQDTDTLSADAIGDIPPPPIPTPPIVGPGIAGIRGTEAGTLARPGSRAAQPFRSAAFEPKRPRFGPGVPVTGGGGTGDAGALGLDPDQAAEILRALAAGGGVR